MSLINSYHKAQIMKINKINKNHRKRRASNNNKNNNSKDRPKEDRTTNSNISTNTRNNVVIMIIDISKIFNYTFYNYNLIIKMFVKGRKR